MIVIAQIRQDNGPAKMWAKKHPSSLFVTFATAWSMKGNAATVRR